MKIRTVLMKNYMLAKQTSVELPERGIVLLKGPNGHGKSMLIEAVAMALWGESLRDETPWRPGKSGEVTVHGSFGTVTRRASSKHVKTISWSECADDSLTAGKAQALLDKVLPPFATWSKTNTYSASMLSSFSNATDKQRKVLLESIIRLDKFDQGQELAKKSLSAAKTEQARIQQATASVKAEICRLETTIQNIASLNDSPVTELELSELRSKAQELNRSLKEMQSKQVELRVQHQEWSRKYTASLTAQRIALDTLNKLNTGFCPVCGQAVSEQKQLATAALEKAKADLSAVGVEPPISKYDREVERVQRELQALTATGRSKREALDRQGQVDKQLDTLKAQKTELENSLGSLASDAAAIQATVDLEETCVAALGLKGIRAYLLAGALAALENSANYWLNKFYPNNSVSLKINLTDDKVAFDVAGLAEDVGYKALSEGQKRRVNLAVVMALGTLAGYAGGNSSGGTLFFDEVLDTLDAEGHEAAAAVLQELAEENCVVVVSHSREMVKRLRPDVIYEVTNGNYQQIVNREDAVS